jgi:hypothetical protein
MKIETLEDTQSEGFRIVDLARESGLITKLIGGLGIAAHDHRSLPAALKREFGDIDLVIGRKNGGQLSDFLTAMGYEANKRFNALHGAKRLLFYDVEKQRQVDVFVGEFSMCHKLNLENFLEVHPRSLTPDYLLLTKLQIFEINHKDLLDILRILYMHATESEHPDCAGISLTRMNQILSTDWGWYTTAVDNLKKVKEISEKTLTIMESNEVKSKISTMIERVESEPKSAKWKARALVGRKKIWYEIPEEVNGAR